ncbi:MAG: hypothetical protein ACLS29_03325 [Prevotellamassilia sp.]
MRYLLFWLLLFTAPGALSAQRAFKPVKLALKAKNYGEAIKQINQLRQDSVYRDAPKLCIYSMEAYQGQNDAQNMKLYLKQSYDTLAFFSTTYQIVNEAIRLDSLEQQLRVTEEQKPKYQNQVKEQLRRYFPNLLVGARFFYKRGKYQEAMPYLRRCLDLPETPLGKDAGLPTKAHQSNASLYVVCAYNTQQYDEVHRYQEWALADTLSRATILECLINTAAAEKDSLAYLQGLQTGWQEFADKPVFFTRLVDYYALRGNYPEVLGLVGKQLGVTRWTLRLVWPNVWRTSILKTLMPASRRKTALAGRYVAGRRKLLVEPPMVPRHCWSPCPTMPCQRLIRRLPCNVSRI